MGKYLSLTGLQQYDTKIKEYMVQNAPQTLYQHTIHCRGQNGCFIATIFSTNATPFDESLLKQWLRNREGLYYPVSGYCSAFSGPTQLYGIVEQGDDVIYLVVGYLSPEGNWSEETTYVEVTEFTDTVIEI